MTDVYISHFTVSANGMIDAQTFRAFLDIMHSIQEELSQQVINLWVFSEKRPNLTQFLLKAFSSTNLLETYSELTLKYWGNLYCI